MTPAASAQRMSVQLSPTIQSRAESLQPPSLAAHSRIDAGSGLSGTPSPPATTAAPKIRSSPNFSRMSFTAKFGLLVFTPSRQPAAASASRVSRTPGYGTSFSQQCSA